MTHFKNPIIIAIVVVLLAGGAYVWWQNSANQEPVACTQEAKLCTDGSYVGRIGAQCEFAACPKENLIVLDAPKAQEKLFSPVPLSGMARGYWYFEASFPVKVLDQNGNVVGQSFASATGEWMTEDFVPFEGTVSFTVSEEQTGTLVLEKDNPSGLPENADEIRIPVILMPLQ